MISGIANVWMPVWDLDRAADFYQHILNLKMIKKDDNWAEFEADGLRIGLNSREPGGTQVEGGPILTFEPEQGLDTVIEELKESGVQFPVGISEHDWGRVATFKDSEGNNLQLYKSPED